MKTIKVLLALLIAITAYWFVQVVRSTGDNVTERMLATQQEAILAEYKLGLLGTVTARKMELLEDLEYRLVARTGVNPSTVGVVGLDETSVALHREFELGYEKSSVGIMNNKLNEALFKLAAFELGLPPVHPDPDKQVNPTPAQLQAAKLFLQNGGEVAHQRTLVYLNELYGKDLWKEQDMIEGTTWAEVPTDVRTSLRRLSFLTPKSEREKQKQ